jgi:hypothetical protein
MFAIRSTCSRYLLARCTAQLIAPLKVVQDHTGRVFLKNPPKDQISFSDQRLTPNKSLWLRFYCGAKLENMSQLREDSPHKADPPALHTQMAYAKNSAVVVANLCFAPLVEKCVSILNPVLPDEPERTST